MPLEVAEFERVLSLGLGRAILHLQKHDATPYRDVILRFCLSNTAYDPQVEGHRSLYLYEIINLTRDPLYFRNAILAALAAAPPEDFNREAQHLFTMVWRFVVEDNDSEARNALYDKYRSGYEAGNTEFGDYDLVDMDGVKAFLFLLDPLQTGRYPDSDVIDDYAYRLRWLDNDGSMVATLHSLNDASKNNPSLREFLARLYLFRRQQEKDFKIRKSRYPDSATLTYKDIRPMIDERKTPAAFRFWSKWGEVASASDFLAAAQDFLTAEDPRIVLAYLNIFSRRAFPLDDFAHLVHFARQETDDNTNYVVSQIPFQAVAVLENIHHPAVRQFALEMIAANHYPGSMVGILQSNFEPNDWSLLEKLAREMTNEDDFHALGMSVRDIYKKQPSKEAIPTLIQLYEHDRCSYCRNDFVEDLASLDAVPEWMAEECKYDSNEYLREFARRGFKDEPSDE